MKMPKKVATAEADVEVTVIVYQARNLLSKKKAKTGKFSVIFGVGSKKFRTDVQESANGNPEWNQESALPITSYNHPLKLVVTDREHVLGAITIEIDEIPLQKTSAQFAPLREYKKSGPPHGELQFNCWISKNNLPIDPQSALSGHRFSFSSSPPKKGGAGGKLKDKILSSDAISKIRHNSLKGSLSNLFQGKKGSKSSYDISRSLGSDGLYRSNSVYSIDDPDENLLSTGRISSHGGSFHVLNDEDDRKPHITGISPMVGPVEGGTRITIRGDNLGDSLEDVIGLFICSANCLANIEYESPKKLYCTTKPWKVSTGNIVVVTQSGGRGSSAVQFQFIDYALTSFEDEASKFRTESAASRSSLFGRNDDSPASSIQTGGGLPSVDRPPSTPSPRHSPVPSPRQQQSNLKSSDSFKDEGYDTKRSSPRPVPKLKEPLARFGVSGEENAGTPSPVGHHRHTLSMSSNTLSIASTGSDEGFSNKHRTTSDHVDNDVGALLSVSPDTARRGSNTLKGNFFSSILKPSDKEKAHHKSMPRVYSDRDLSKHLDLAPLALEKTEKRRGSLMPWNKDKSTSLTKSEMMNEISRQRFESERLRIENDKVKLENEELRAENTHLRDSNTMMQTYMDRILIKVMLECPHLLDVSSS
ncbi:uncharacterized protein LOC141906050 [Tubulanus polymorphus]|uniref:uncharacterized protein LOC141906050 n=1 Tax=Tubulanus polymorphus TaxID=672921 RepID=UPI003DA290EB